jgi:hypothetical protein
MAQQAADTLIEWSLEDYLADLIAKSGCKRYDALCEMRERIRAGRLILIRQRLVDGKPYNPFDRKPCDKEEVDPHYDFYSLSFDGNYKVRVGVTSNDSFEYCYTVAEPLPVSQIAPAQLEDKVGPDLVEAEVVVGASAGEAPQESKAAVGKLSSAQGRDAAIEARFGNGEIPGSTVQWARFCHDIRTDCDAFIGDPKKQKFKRGFSDGQITRVARRLMKLRQA